MRTLFLSLAVFVIVAAGAIGISWFFQASEIRKGVERTIAAVNEKEPYLTYDSIETTGFPHEVAISLINPRFTGRMDQMEWIKTLQQGPNGIPKNLPEWQENMLLDGSLTLTVNMLSSRYTLGMRGNWQSESSINGQTFALASEISGEASCTLVMSAGSLFETLWSFKPLTDEERWKEGFRELDCLLPANRTLRKSDNALITSAGDGRVYVSHKPQGNQRQVRVVVNSKDTEITPAGDEIILLYLNTFMPDYPYTTGFSAYGKQNIDIDFLYDGPATWSQGELKNAPFDVYLSKFNLSNAAYVSDAAFRVNQTLGDGNRAGQFYFKTHSTFSELYDPIVRDMTRGAIREMYRDGVPELQPYRTKLPPTEEELYAIVEPVLPNFHSLGTLTSAVDASYSGAENFSSGEGKLAQFELSSSLYGITGNGTAQKTPQQMFPAVNMDFACRNCGRMIDDIFAYTARVQKMLAKLSPEDHPAPFHPSLPAGIKGFLQVLSEPQEDASNFRYTIVSDGMMGVTVSGRKMDEVMTLYGQYVAPFLTPPVADAPAAVD